MSRSANYPFFSLLPSLWGCAVCNSKCTPLAISWTVYLSFWVHNGHQGITETQVHSSIDSHHKGYSHIHKSTQFQSFIKMNEGNIGEKKIFKKQFLVFLYSVQFYYYKCLHSNSELLTYRHICSNTFLAVALAQKATSKLLTPAL